MSPKRPCDRSTPLVNRIKGSARYSLGPNPQLKCEPSRLQSVFNPSYSYLYPAFLMACLVLTLTQA